VSSQLACWLLPLLSQLALLLSHLGLLLSQLLAQLQLLLLLVTTWTGATHRATHSR
jgi:hypothetical protein